jgi:hypothetical protein
MAKQSKALQRWRARQEFARRNPLLAVCLFLGMTDEQILEVFSGLEDKSRTAHRGEEIPDGSEIGGRARRNDGGKGQDGR